MEAFFNDEEQTILTLLQDKTQTEKLEIMGLSLEKETDKVNRTTLENFLLKVSNDYERRKDLEVRQA